MSSLDVVRDPLNKEARVLGLDALHLVLDLLHRDLASEVGGNGQVATVARVTRSHHVLGIEHLRCQLRHGDSTVLLAAARCQGRKADHEEVEPREGNHVDSELAQVRVQLPRETQACGDARHNDGDEVVQIAVLGRVELERAEADVVQRFVVDAECLVGVLYELVHGESGVVRLDNGVRDLHLSTEELKKIKLSESQVSPG